MVPSLIREVSRANFKSQNSGEELFEIMSGFQNIAGIPYCVGATDGSLVRWMECPVGHYFEYSCFKGYSSPIILLYVIR